jgi:hypothetical protein
MTLSDGFFKNLSEEEKEEFRAWAREFFKPGVEPNGTWHPVVREEWRRLQKEYDDNDKKTD